MCLSDQTLLTLVGYHHEWVIQCQVEIEVNNQMVKWLYLQSVAEREKHCCSLKKTKEAELLLTSSFTHLDHFDQLELYLSMFEYALTIIESWHIYGSLLHFGGILFWQKVVMQCR